MHFGPRRHETSANISKNNQWSTDHQVHCFFPLGNVTLHCRVLIVTIWYPLAPFGTLRYPLVPFGVQSYQWLKHSIFSIFSKFKMLNVCFQVSISHERVSFMIGLTIIAKKVTSAILYGHMISFQTTSMTHLFGIFSLIRCRKYMKCVSE